MPDRQPAPIDVLHVDDDPGLCEVVAAFLEREHDWLTVHTETDAEAVLACLSEVDCVVSDYDMPGMDGLELLRAARERHPELPFILYTGKGNEEIASEAISAGVDDYLQKDTGTDQYTVLANRVRNVVERRRARTAVETSERRYHNLIDTAPVAIVLFDADTEVAYANAAAVELLDADDRSDLEGVAMPELLVPEDREQARERFRRIVENDEAAPEVEFTLQTFAGERKQVLVATAPGVYRGRRVAQAVAKRMPE